jgi:hypothetical protein
MGRFLTSLLFLAVLTTGGRERSGKRVSRVAEGLDRCTVTMTLDHNRMVVDGAFQRRDGSWRNVRLWVDSGNPDLFLSEALARDLGLDLGGPPSNVVGGRLEVPIPSGLRIGHMDLKLEDLKAWVVFAPDWLFSATHSDANLPSSVLRRYQVVFDYPNHQLTLASPGTLEHRGTAAPASIHPATGVVQLAAIIDSDTLSFALDNGASYSFTSERVLQHLSDAHPDWPTHIGAVGAANIWGWWPREEAWPILRVPEIRWGGVRLEQVGLVGLGEIFGPGFDLGAWYSEKTARPVDGFLGPNAFGSYEVEIDYANDSVYFVRGPEPLPPDMDLVGLTLRPEDDGGYSVLGVAQVDGASPAPGVEPGDRLLRVDGLETRGATMGAVVDALRGKPGDTRLLVLERDGRRYTVSASVRRLLGLAPPPGGAPMP